MLTSIVVAVTVGLLAIKEMLDRSAPEGARRTGRGLIFLVTPLVLLSAALLVRTILTS